MDIKKIMNNQPVINVGMIGHVSNGKSTIVKTLTGKKTQQHSNEQERNITIKLGYANAKIFKCNICKAPECYTSAASHIFDLNCQCGNKMELVNHISFVDCFDPLTEVLTYSGQSKKISDLTKNDKLIGPDGKMRNILNFCEGEKELYEINYKTTSNNSIMPNKFICTGGHLLVLRIDTPVDTVAEIKKNTFMVRIYNGNKDKFYSNCYYFNSREEAEKFYDEQNKDPLVFEMTVETYLNCPTLIKNKAQMFYSSAIEFENKPFDISIPNLANEETAWLIGLWLGDGSKSLSKFSVGENDIEIMGKLELLSKKLNLTIHKYKKNNVKCYEVIIRKEIITKKNKKAYSFEHDFTKLLKKLNLINNKHIGPELMLQPRTVREAMLAGFIDSDGFYGKGQFEITRSEEYKNLIDGLTWIIKSLGYSCHVSQKLSTLKINEVIRELKHYILKFNGEASRLPICTERKKGKDIERNWSTSQPFTIKSINKGKYRGFEVDNDGRFLLADFVVAHNCPGHHLLMSTMLNGTCVMDYTILVESLNNENIPAPQTVEHIKATTITNTPNTIVCFNKLDLLKKPDVEKKIKIFKKYASETILSKSSVVPIVASLGLNIDVLCEELSKLKPPQHNLNEKCKMIVIRSFNANKPGTSIKDLKGGVIGGSLVNGIITVNDNVILKPGFVLKNENYSENNENSKRWKYKPVSTKVLSIQSEINNLDMAIPGGLIGVQLDIDPALTANDGLVGNIVMSSDDDKKYNVFEDIEIEFRPLFDDKLSFKDNNKVSVNINASNENCEVLRYKKNIMILKILSNPICVKKGDDVTVSVNTNTGEGFTIIGKGTILDGNCCQLC